MEMKMKRQQALICVLLVLSVVLSCAVGSRPSNLFYTNRKRTGNKYFDKMGNQYQYHHQDQHQNKYQYQHQYQYHHSRAARPPPERIDGRFGADKRRVPTGSNPLHNRSYVNKGTPRHRC